MIWSSSGVDSLTQRGDWLVDCWTVRCLERHFSHEAGFLGSTQWRVPAFTPMTSPLIFLAEDLKPPSFLAYVCGDSNPSSC